MIWMLILSTLNGVTVLPTTFYTREACLAAADAWDRPLYGQTSICLGFKQGVPK